MPGDTRILRYTDPDANPDRVGHLQTEFAREQFTGRIRHHPVEARWMLAELIGGAWVMLIDDFNGHVETVGWMRGAPSGR
jgi:hypothetical protein